MVGISLLIILYFTYIFQFDGFEELKTFIENTSGNNLLQFWLDCENFKDMMEDYDETQINATRNRLFR